MININSKLYIFLIWEKSRNKTQAILEDLEKKFVIRDVYEVTWNKENFHSNLRRFYGQSLPDAKEKARLCGTGPFLLAIISDPNPKFVKANVRFEEDLVNENIHNCKVRYRKWIGGDFAVHSSISENETNHNIALLFGKDPKILEKELDEKWSGTIKKLEADLVGQNGWQDLQQIIDVLNWSTKYVILRNFEGIPNNSDFRDIDLLADDQKIVYIINKSFSPATDNVRYFETDVGNKTFLFNPNFIGDHYYDEKWEENILKQRFFHSNGFYVPSDEDYFYTLLYHIIFHKRWKNIDKIPEKYKTILKHLATKLKLKEDIPSILNNLHDSKKFLENYMHIMKYKNTSSTNYKIAHNEYSRLIRVTIFLVKTQGIRFLFTAIKLKIKYIMGLK